ncbi:phosphate ABC transporter permease PstA [Cryobacterium sp. HLT2-28]|uniref:phosphate ABC transporter permease PstA n=1 Tax=Cryobacterium sp. HLT2-28 TaxID=1259146 RepID=UPI001F5436BB|nr:phosphate ABC transporter permease PstA [Cryobacterium sp. HLT2-28]
MTLTMTPTVDAGGPATDIRRADPTGGEPDPRASAQTTRIHSVEGVEVGPRRRVRSARLDDRFNVLGAAAAGIAVAVLLFGWFTPLSGGVGWVLVAFVAFLGFYALLVSLSSDWQEVKDRVMAVMLTSAGVILFGSLVFVVAFTITRGQEALPHLNFFTQSMELAGPLDGLDLGGIAHAILGTLMQITMALIVTVPLGIVTALFLNEVGGPFARFVRTISDAMTALPSIVAGLFVYSAIIVLITHQRSGFAASMAITVMMLPIVIRASDIVLRLVPGNLREAAYALGSTRWRTVWHVVLPTARPGLATAVILGTARGIGETSPVLLTSGVTAVVNLNPFEGPMISLPLQVFDFVKSPEPTMIARGFGAAAVLLLLVLALFYIARVIGGRGPGELSRRQQLRVIAASARDHQRITVRSARGRAAGPPESSSPLASPPAASSPSASAQKETSS